MSVKFLHRYPSAAAMMILAIPIGILSDGSSHAIAEPSLPSPPVVEPPPFDYDKPKKTKKTTNRNGWSYKRK